MLERPRHKVALFHTRARNVRVLLHLASPTPPSGMGNVAMTFFLGFFLPCIWSHGTVTSTTCSLSLRLDPTVCEFPSPLVTVFDVPVAHAGLSDAWGVGQHLEHRSSGLSESDVLFLWLLVQGVSASTTSKPTKPLDQPTYASMRA